MANKEKDKNENSENMVPLFPNDKGNCAYVDMDRLVKETFSEDFMWKITLLSVIGLEKDTAKREELLKQFVEGCEKANKKE